MKLQYEDIEFLVALFRKMEAEDATTLLDILIRTWDK